jgi:cytochrome d ubiquinol oxidase subunit I
MGTSLGFHIVFAVLGVGLPLLLMTAEGLWLRTKDEAWLTLARRWSRAFGILFAVGAFSGAIFGLPFSAEGFAFFIEAIFLGLYLYGWNRLTPFAHWLTSIPIVVSGAGTIRCIAAASSSG